MGFGFLTDKELKDKFQSLISEASFEPNLASGASYDLTLGEEVYISGEEYPKLLSAAEPFISIPRGQFALLMTKEYITMPNNYLGFISIKFDIKKQGLINISGFHVDPGFEGKIIYSVFNAGPTDVVLQYRQRIFMIFFYQLEQPATPYAGNKKGQTHLPTDLVTALKGTSASLSDVDRRVHRLETMGWIFSSLLLALLAAIITVAVKR